MTSNDTAPQRIADLEIIRPLAEGGMAEILLARDPATGEQVVLKVPLRTESAALSPEARLRREAEILRRLDHPHLVRLRDEIVTERGLILVLDHVDGTNLREWMREAPDPSAWRPLLEQVIGAVAHCHTDLGLIHRDIKPENVLVDRDRSHAVLCDFGIALFVNQTRLTLPHHVLGTSPYLPPRLRRGGSGPSTADDVYALAVIAAELITGRAAGEGDLVNALGETESVSDALQSLLHDILTETHTPRDAGAFLDAWRAGWNGETVTRPARLLSTGDRLRTQGFRHLRERDPLQPKRGNSLKGVALFGAATALTASAALAAILATRGGFDLGLNSPSIAQNASAPVATDVGTPLIEESAPPIPTPGDLVGDVISDTGETGLPLAVPPPPPLEELSLPEAESPAEPAASTSNEGVESPSPAPAQVAAETLQHVERPDGQWVVVSEPEPRIEIARSRPRPTASAAPHQMASATAPSPPPQVERAVAAPNPVGRIESPAPAAPEPTPEERLREALRLAQIGESDAALTRLQALEREGHLPAAWRSQLALLERD